MPRDENIVLSVQGGNRRGAFRGGTLWRTKTTLNSNSQSSEDDTSLNLSKIVTVGLAFNKAQQANEIVGAYTENRYRQRQIENSLLFAKYGVGISTLGPAGVVYAVGDLAYRGINYGIKLQKLNKEARYYRELSGNNANSGRRYRGDYV